MPKHEREAERPEGAEAPVEGTTGAERTEATGEDAGRQVERDLDELTEARRERDEYLELAQRTRADFDNYRKRVARENDEAVTRGKVELARELIPALDNLERALRAAGVDPDTGQSTAQATGGEAGAAGAYEEAPSREVSAQEALAQGVALVYRELKATLERAGVSSYDPRGERFDPSWHEALSTRAADGTEPGVVVETVDKGYRLDGQVLRPARVVVSE